MGRKKSVPGPLVLVQQPVTAAATATATATAATANGAPVQQQVHAPTPRTGGGLRPHQSHQLPVPQLHQPRSHSLLHKSQSPSQSPLSLRSHCSSQHSPAHSQHSQSQSKAHLQSQSQAQAQAHPQSQSPSPSQSQSQSHHSAKVVPTLGFLGETQRLSPEAASISDGTSISVSTASLSVSSVSPRSPKSLYTSKFSPRNLLPSSNKSPLRSPAPSQLQPRSQPSSQPPTTIPRKAVPQLTVQETVPTAKGTIPLTHPHPQQRQHHHNQRPPHTPTPPTDRPTTHQQRQRHLFPSGFTSRSQDSLVPSNDSKHLHIAELHQHFPPITKASTTSSQQQSTQHPQSQRRLKSRHGRRHADEKSASVSDLNDQLHQYQDSGHKQGFFSNFSNKSAKSSDRPSHQPLPPQALQAAQLQSTRAGPAMSATDQADITKQSSKHPDTAYAPAPNSETSLGNGDPNSTPTSTKKASKPKPFTLLSRTKSQREKNARSPRHTPSPQDTKDTVSVPTSDSKTARVPIMELNPPDTAPVAQTPKSAATPHDSAYREAMSSNSRNHSADRAHSRETSSDRRGHQEKDHHPRSHQSGPRDGSGPSSFFNNLRREGGRVAETIGKGLFGKSGRSASTTERDPVDDEHYVLKVITLPLIEQTRLTRISKRLEESRDKTEFWMPAFPWRAIDYLNYKGCDVEGLYRVPGSGPQIKKWQRRFDELHDVDLFAQEDLYDINIIGSMLKAWLRELPDELFPKEAQDRIARECMGSETVPQMLIDELSNLSPFNYYLLFAITCHLSLLLAHSDKNKMDFRNLCICFQPCMKIDAFCFKFLVCDWRDCWKGCKTEARYIEEEYKLFDQPPPPGLGIKKKLEPRTEGQPQRLASPSFEREERERNLSSADSSTKKSQNSGDQARLKKKSPPPLENGRENGNTIAVPRTVHTELEAPRRSNERGPTSQDAGDMRPLSPIKPLSPLGF